MTTYASNSRQILSMKGTASVPSFSFQGSNKTGWYLSNTNEMSAAINGSQYLTINSSGVISNVTWGGTTIATNYGGTGLTSFTTGSAIYATSPSVLTSGILPITGGGTSLSSYSTGDMIYASATNTLAKLPAGTNGYFLGLAGGLPTWLPVGPPGSVASFSAGTTGFSPSSPTIGAITLSGTLNTTNGGTGLTSFTSGGALYATSTSALATGTLPSSSGGTGLTSFTANGAVYATSTSALATGTLPIASGGTNSTATPLAGSVAYGTGTAISYTSVGTVGQFLTSNGSGTPIWQSLGPSLSTITFGTTGLTPSTPTSGAITVAGTLVPANGGTGITTVPANGQILIGNGTNYTAATLTAGSGISINNAAGSVTITCTVAVGAQGYVTQFSGPSGPPTFRSQGFGII